MQGVFIIGEQRSGSNLLRIMLAGGGLAAPHPAHVLSRLSPILQSYGDLSRVPNWLQLVEDCCQLVERNPIPWSPLKEFDRGDIANRCRERSLVAIFGALMDTYAEANDATAWVCKSMGAVNFVDELDAYFDNPKYIYLYRDARDVTLSFTKAVVGEKHPYHIARRWAARQRSCIAERERLGADRVHSVSYEELTANPSWVLKDLCEFLEIPFTDEMLRGHESKDAVSAVKKSQLWENLDQPVLKTNSRKFLSGLDRESILIVESLAGDVLDQLGYDRVCGSEGESVTFSEEQVRRFTQENEAMKAERRAAMDPEDADRRRQQLTLLTDRVYFLKDIERDDRLRFLSFVEEEHYLDGDVVISESESSTDMFFVISGVLEIIPDSQRKRRIEAGEPLGEFSFITGKAGNAAVICQEKARLFRLTRDAFAELETNNPRLAVRVLHLIAEHLSIRLAGPTR
ncbi:MAG TPA: sulfotransferase [Planctomycetota bacterium]|nr:sulfotransferase [Planctomycetota bacterium]